MVKVLLAHNFYRSTAPSGEDVVYRDERALMEANGVEVIPYERFNENIDEKTFWNRLTLGYETAWSQRTYKEITSLVRKTRLDVAHFHNTFPLISPSAYAACKDQGVPVVQTLHNFRLICPGGLLLREGRPCEDCVGGSLYPALRHRCYRGSLPATTAVAWMLVRNRWYGTYSNLVDRYIALTHFQENRLVAGGLPAEKVRIKPNFLLEDAPQVEKAREHFAVYVGNLGAHKGVKTLLKAWRELPNLPLKIVGSGPLEIELKAYAKSHALNVEFLGFLPRSKVLKVIGRAMVQVVPSECYEGFPLAVIEAYAFGTPVIASRIGSLPELLEDGRTGLLFKAGDANDLAKKVAHAASDHNAATWGRVARDRYLTHYHAQASWKILLSIYSELKKPPRI